MRINKFIFIILPMLFVFHLYGQNTNTTLKDPEQIKEFLKVTERIRCICLPSLPIQGCSYNMCIVSSYLKTFIENRIREGMTAEEILYKFEKGFGESIFKEPVDEVILYFQKEGNQRMLSALQYGFGTSIYAKPDSTWINLSLSLIGIIGFLGIGYYLYSLLKKPNIPTTEANLINEKKWDDLESKYLKEMEDENV